MRTIFQLFLDIAFFRKGPQDVPASIILQRLCLLAYALSGWMGIVLNATPGTALAQVLIDMAVLAATSWVGLHFNRHIQRYGQTLTALTGVGTIFSVLAWPLLLWLALESPDGDIIIPALLLTCLGLWNIAVIGRVLQHAWGSKLSTCIFCAIGYTLLSWVLIVWVA